MAVLNPNHANDHARAPVKLSACLESRLPVQRAQRYPRGLWVYKKLLNLRGEAVFLKKLVPDATFSRVSCLHDVQLWSCSPPRFNVPSQNDRVCFPPATSSRCCLNKQNDAEKLTRLGIMLLIAPARCTRFQLIMCMCRPHELPADIVRSTNTLLGRV